MAVALTALFVALGGIGYAATSLPKNSVGTKQLRNGAVTAIKVKNFSLLASNFKAGQLPAGPPGSQGPRGPQGAVGPIGATGLQGAKGNDGSPGVSNYQVLLFGEIVQSTDTQGGWTVGCPAGTKILGGGVATFNKNIQIETSTPLDTGTSWAVSVVPLTGSAFGGSASAVNIRIVCATVAP
jgi:hypothetical protein